MRFLTVLFPFLFLIPSASDNCQKCLVLSFYSCKVCYDSCQSPPTFASCWRTTCDVYAGEEEGVGTCNQYDLQSLTQEVCFQKCCETIKSTSFSISDLQTCEEENNKNLGITIGVICGVFLLLVMLGVGIYCKKTQTSARQCLEVVCGCDCFGENEKQINISWKTEQNYELKKSKCEACKGENGICVGECGHVYDLFCLILRKTCDSCYKPLGKAKVFCDKCKKSYFQFNTSKYVSKEKIEEEVKKNQCPTCQESMHIFKRK